MLSMACADDRLECPVNPNAAQLAVLADVNDCEQVCLDPGRVVAPVDGAFGAVLGDGSFGDSGAGSGSAWGMTAFRTAVPMLPIRSVLLWVSTVAARWTLSRAAVRAMDRLSRSGSMPPVARAVSAIAVRRAWWTVRMA